MFAGLLSMIITRVLGSAAREQERTTESVSRTRSLADGVIW
jgi:hypothetical protein